MKTHEELMSELMKAEGQIEYLLAKNEALLALVKRYIPLDAEL